MISRFSFLTLLSLLAFLDIVSAQSPTKEYIYLGGRVIAIENPVALPTISTVSPTAGVVGTAVTITGSNFGTTGTVKFNGVTATTSSWTATSISTTVPSGATTGGVVVTVNGVNSNGATFTVTTPETVSAPTTPSGPTSVTRGLSYTYTTGGSSSSLGNPLQYRFTWGDGTDSGWLANGTTSSSHAWSSTGTKSVTAQARSVPTGVLSSASTARSVAVAAPYANFSISSSSLHTYDSWVLTVTSNIANTAFTLCAIVPGQGQSCTPNWGTTGSNGGLSVPGSIPPGNLGTWEEWIEFPTLGVSSNHITFTVSDYATVSLNPSGGGHVGTPWTFTVQSSIRGEWFTICAKFPDGSQSCTPNFAQTSSTNGSKTLTGTFTSSDVGAWQEWVVFPTATSNTISFTVTP